MYFSKNKYTFCRFAVSISSKIGNSNQRNYMKRRMREWFRKRQYSLAHPYDIWISVKKNFSKTLADQVENKFENAISKIEKP